MIWVRASYGGVIGHTWGALKCAKMHQNGPKWTKIVHNGQYIMSEQKCFEFVLSNLSDLFMDNKKPWKGIGVSTTHGGAMELHMRCTIMHLSQKKIILVTWEKFKTVYSVMLWWPFWSIFIHFGAFWCASYHVQPHNPSMTSISPFKCPSNPEKDNKSYSRQIQISLLYHAMVKILVHFGHLVHFMCNPMTPPWIVLTP